MRWTTFFADSTAPDITSIGFPPLGLEDDRESIVELCTCGRVSLFFTKGKRTMQDNQNKSAIILQTEAAIEQRIISQSEIGKKIVTVCHLLMKNGAIFSGINYGPEDRQFHSHEVAHAKSYEIAFQKALEAVVFLNAEWAYRLNQLKKAIDSLSQKNTEQQAEE